MPQLSMLFGVLLIVLGLVGYFAPDTLGENDPGKVSPTALIPSAIGAILLLCGLAVAAKPALRKHLMHLAAVVGLVGAAGGFMPLMRSKFDFTKASAVSGLLMIGLCALFVLLCVRSFIRARIARKQGLPDTPRGT